ncbi:uncharacterized protein UV8b_04861 [Ustilaginoidea virens]|uniref:BCAS2 family protein n=1 Tax=Ustilaginoidea virens TaxID=1159556 RepID=A0A8E5HS41_USTVR|nr:uncharacterized protein UV8b_04861 [Ustilaginoidea virens]QUC20620.1 hypothetical protein UV8b_04861 [Ustilaginoidea virens]
MAPAFHDSLPYIDPPPSEAHLHAARLLIQHEQQQHEQQQHEQQQHEQHQQASPPPPPRAPIPPLDTKRYEAQVLPPPGTPPADLRPVLARAFASAQYLAARGDNLALLDRHGPPAWLLANYHLESEVRALEAELADTRRRIDQVNHERATRQAGVKPELDGLEEAWRKGLGRVLETEVAVDEVKAQIRQELRRRNAGPA